MITVRDWLKKKWGGSSLRALGAEIGVDQQSVRQWALGLAAPSLRGCRKLSAAMAREGLVADPVALYSEAAAFSAQLREKMRAALDEATKIEETEAEDNTPGSDTISGAR
jgi:hypothetical protein